MPTRVGVLVSSPPPVGRGTHRGFVLLNDLQVRHLDQVMAFLLVIIATVVIIEMVSILIRRAVK